MAVICQMKQFKPPKLAKKRAVSDELKDLRRESILNATEFLLSKHLIDDISMAIVASTIKLAKGTLYLYFKTKEELFLSLLDRAYLRWFDEVENWVDSQTEINSNNLAKYLAESFSAQSTLLLLVPYAESILEKNISLDRIIEHKRSMNIKLVYLSNKISEKNGVTSTEKIALSFLFIHAAIVGLYFKSFPCPLVAEALKQPDLVHLKIDFKASLQIMLEAIFAKLL